MKKVILIFIGLFAMVSCYYEDTLVVVADERSTFVDLNLLAENKVQSYDLWTFEPSVSSVNPPRFFNLSFTLSFLSLGELSANNNIYKVGDIGNGYGDRVGSYYFRNGFLEVDHLKDGHFTFEVFLQGNTLTLLEVATGLDYVFTGNFINQFNFDVLFYNHIDALLQEFQYWQKLGTNGGVENIFDRENYIRFLTNSTFESSVSPNNTHVIQWNYGGRYQVFDTRNPKIKELRLTYDAGAVEVFDLKIENDHDLFLCHIRSRTEYRFRGQQNIVFSKVKKLVVASK